MLQWQHKKLTESTELSTPWKEVNPVVMATQVVIVTIANTKVAKSYGCHSNTKAIKRSEIIITLAAQRHFEN